MLPFQILALVLDCILKESDVFNIHRCCLELSLQKIAFGYIFSTYFHISRLDVKVHSEMCKGEYNFREEWGIDTE